MHLVFQVYYLTQQLDEGYQDELKLSQFMGFLTVVGILVSAIGLYAISYYLQLSRTREIGIRKVLGASVVAGASMSWHILKNVLANPAKSLQCE